MAHKCFILLVLRYCKIIKNTLVYTCGELTQKGEVRRSKVLPHLGEKGENTNAMKLESERKQDTLWSKGN